MVAMALWGQSVSSPDYLSLMAAHSNEVLFWRSASCSWAWPAPESGFRCTRLKPHGEALALGVVGFRVMEGTLQIASAVSMVPVGYKPGICKGRQPCRFFFQPVAAAVQSVRELDEQRILSLILVRWRHSSTTLYFTEPGFCPAGYLPGACWAC